ncbi:MAG: anaerobic ribonucleoside-triphosphate reductase activating protein [Lachnospiraceae bacterium]|nr:anaerobic ribonucleoside-triphosphate reductase activating protein [Lachnospiraceae bacterium]
MQIHGLNKTTLLDYPGIVASTVFTGSCNFRCPYCQNADLVLDPMSQPLISEEEVLSHIKKRKGIIKGVCITGGEPTLQKDLREFIVKLKELDVLVKLDTYGYRPDVTKDLIKEGLIDYVAMDIKSSPEGYSDVAGIKIDTSIIKESVDLIMSSGIDYEFRTTVIREFHNEETFKAIGEFIRGAEKYYLQGYIDSERVIERRFSSYSREELEKLVKIVSPYVQFVDIRGVD